VKERESILPTSRSRKGLAEESPLLNSWGKTHQREKNQRESFLRCRLILREGKGLSPRKGYPSLANLQKKEGKRGQDPI